jgi:hypothetical protein
MENKSKQGKDSWTRESQNDSPVNEETNCIDREGPFFTNGTYEEKETASQEYTHKACLPNQRVFFDKQHLGKFPRDQKKEEAHQEQDK